MAATTTATPTSDEMITFCCDRDRYGHPLLWCEERRRLLQRQNAEECLRMWRRRKAEENARKEKEKREYYELCLKHCPWGRPGGGAPNQDIRRKDITALGLHSTAIIPSSTAHCLPSLRHCHYNDLFSQRKNYNETPASSYHHHPRPQHAPRRITVNSSNPHHITNGTGSKVTDHHAAAPDNESKATEVASEQDRKSSEALQITLKDHPTVLVRGKGQVNIEVRYKTNTNGKPLLKKIVVTENDSRHEPSPTIVPVEATLENSHRKTSTIQVRKPSKNACKRGEAVGSAWNSPKSVGIFMKSLGWTNNEMLKDLDQDNPVTPAEKHTFRKVRPTKKLERCCASCICKCQAPAMTSAGCLKALPKKPTTLKNRINHSSIIKEESIKLSQNNRMTTTDQYSTGGGIELVPLLARRRATNRPISLSSTDITKWSTGNDRLSTAVSPSYLHDLNKQITEKRHSNNVTIQLEKEMSSKHFQTFDTFWGRPGHGAPIEIKTKLKLDNLLYGDGTQIFSE